MSRSIVSSRGQVCRYPMKNSCLKQPCTDFAPTAHLASVSFFFFSMKTPERNFSLTSFYLPFWLETLAMQMAGYTHYADFVNFAACIYMS